MLSPSGRIAAVLSCIMLLVTCYISLYSRHLFSITFTEKHHVSREATPELRTDLDDELNYRARPGVQTRTPWNASIMWELMFDNNLFDRHHKKANTAVALTVFAVGRYLEAYLKTFLTSAEEHFMLGLPVTYFLFTDLPEKVPNIKLAPHRNIQVVKVEKYSRWQDISMMRMKTISEVIDTVLQHNFTYVFCFDVDQIFKARFGSEALGESVALLHAHYYKLPKYRFTYDRNSKSKAYMTEGDYYYHAAIFGGTCEKVKALADYCYANIMEDKINDVEALWHDESHLNKYFWLKKPTKLLSPEYCWDNYISDTTDILIKRLVWAPKDYEKLRTG
ncbi:N-acetyllactosaminide alpha-1,3-galactosyltransferase-like isoform X1 [Girardinichthys multiradiatus]|uniref:N-acetyllactosaminide alpha-1,3-galactosyltransferase-like isoform X1 n=1 Tax=Girardinichthys multiradiatus TaxID=208333 RepID=UPI001FAD8B7F|nr:N-acetyllactosaminide alpha-1,3-galactosyltransferase-like isoform X1 [Girardinichthys multiradiatus]